MNYELRFRPELVDDAHEAFLWYESAATGLGHAFLRSYFAATAAIQREPLMQRKVHLDFRRVLLGRFPYALYFFIENQTVVVSLLIHSARAPSLVRHLLRDRKRRTD